MANRVNLGNIIGATGATGPQGPAGQNGANGLTPYIQNGTWWIGSQDTNVIAKGNEWYYGTEIPTVQGNNGDLYLNTDTNDVYKKESGIWGLITNIKGAKGDKGDKGDTALSVTVGTVTTASSDTPASVTNSGTSTDLVLDFVIPKGETGEQGEKGDTGASSVFVGGFLADTISFDSDPQGQIDNKLSGNFGSENVGKYLQVDNNGNVQAVSSDAENDVIDGYYYNGAFYEDSEHTIQLIGASGKIYIDVVENLQYRYNGSSYVPLTADLSDYATIDYVDDRFNGASKAIAYNSYSAMITVFNNLDDDIYNIGQNINIVTLEVPDLWISSIQETSVPYTYVDDATFTSALATNGYVQVGYYKLSALETQKVDLTDYQEKLTAGTGITIDSNNVISASSGNAVTLGTETQTFQGSKQFNIQDIILQYKGSSRYNIDIKPSEYFGIRDQADYDRYYLGYITRYRGGNYYNHFYPTKTGTFALTRDIPTLKTFTNTLVSTWVADSTYTDYGYKATITLTGVTADMIPQVIFGATEAVSGNYLPIAESFAGGIYIYSKVNDTITIPTIIVQKAV